VARAVHVSNHAAKRFRARCSEGSPWPEFPDGELKDWIAVMVRDNVGAAKYYKQRRGQQTVTVPLIDEGVLLAVAICDQSKFHTKMAAVKTIFGPHERGWSYRCEIFAPTWWTDWVARLELVS